MIEMPAVEKIHDVSCSISEKYFFWMKISEEYYLRNSVVNSVTFFFREHA